MPARTSSVTPPDTPDPTVDLTAYLADARHERLSAETETARIEDEKTRSAAFRRVLNEAVWYPTPWVDAQGRPIERDKAPGIAHSGSHPDRFRRPAPAGDPRWQEWADKFITAGTLLQDFGLNVRLCELYRVPYEPLIWATDQPEPARGAAIAMWRLACDGRRDDLVRYLVALHTEKAVVNPFEWHRMFVTAFDRMRTGQPVEMGECDSPAGDQADQHAEAAMTKPVGNLDLVKMLDTALKNKELTSDQYRLVSLLIDEATGRPRPQQRTKAVASECAGVPVEEMDRNAMKAFYSLKTRTEARFRDLGLELAFHLQRGTIVLLHLH